MSYLWARMTSMVLLIQFYSPEKTLAKSTITVVWYIWLEC
jgi:hypothetical protein